MTTPHRVCSLLVLAPTLAAMTSACGPATRAPAAGTPPAHAAEPPGTGIEWNQAFIARRLGLPAPEFASGGPTPPEPDFNDPRSVLRFVLACSPIAPVVYPSERYFYFRFPLGPRVVSGNIRFADADLGTVSVGYFDADNPRDLRTAEFRHGDGLTALAFDPAALTADLTFDGHRRLFSFDRTAFEHASLRLLDGEVLISGLLDESGYFLHLIYWKPGRCFYYVLNPDQPRPEPWSADDSTGSTFLFGRDSRFCFYAHRPTGRLVLVGVSRRQIELNTWFDGPFDQVPPRLDIGPILEEAYPYLRDAGGIDRHGNFLARAGHRVAISPYREYDAGEDLLIALKDLISEAPAPSAWVRATYEPKRDWRAPSYATEGASHSVNASSAWPANHWGWSSAAWGTDHLPASSAAWPPNHDQAVSRGGPTHRPPPPPPPR